MRRSITGVLFALGVAACRDNAPQVAAQLAFSEFPDTMVVGESRELTATCLDGNGEPIPNHPVQWVVVESQLANLRASGSTAVIYAMHPNWHVEIVAACQRSPISRIAFNSGNGGWDYDARVRVRSIAIVAPEPAEWRIDDYADFGDTLVLRAPTVDDSLSGTMHLVSARGVTALGYVVPRTSFGYTVSDPSVAGVGTSGWVRAVRVGETTLRVNYGAQERWMHISVRDDSSVAPWDVGLVDAHWTQGPQSADQSVPILRESRAAVVNVIAAATVDSIPMSARLEVLDATSTVVFTDTVPLTLSARAVPSFGTPNAQFLVPRSIVAVAASWRIFAMGPGVDADGTPSNNRLPRTGETVLNAITPPVLKLHLVPIVLSSHGNAVTPLLPEHRVYYDSIARLRLPVGRVEVTIGSPITSNAKFFDSTGASTGGSAPFWQSILEKVDAARVRSSMADRYWIGVVPKPPGSTSSRYGGMGYIPEVPNSTGPMTRSQVVIGHDWRPTIEFTVGTTVAHELGHNFSRNHAPCGSAGGPDEHYPVANGGIGQWVTWTTAFETGVQPTGQILAPSTGDLMGYCGSNYLGTYTYLGMLRFRTLANAGLVVPRERAAILAVRGWVTADSARVTQSEFTDGERIAEPTTSPVIVVALAADGTELARHRALVGATGDGGAGRPFTAHIPMDAATHARVARVVAHIIRR